MSFNSFSGELEDIAHTVSVDHHSLTFFFEFSRSLFAGELPESIGQLTALKELRLFENNFTGTEVLDRT